MSESFVYPQARGPHRTLLQVMIAIVLLITPFVASAGDYPNGATTSGTVTNVASFDSGWVRFVVQGTKANGQPGAEAFFVDTNTVAGKAHYANILSAAAQGKIVYVFHYGDLLSIGGQAGYGVPILFVSY